MDSIDNKTKSKELHQWRRSVKRENKKAVSAFQGNPYTHFSTKGRPQSGTVCIAMNDAKLFHIVVAILHIEERQGKTD